MARHQPVNAAFMAALEALRAQGAAPALFTGVFGALGVPFPETPDPGQYPILGFHLRATPESILLYLLTPGRFIRYEVGSDSRTLTVAVPTAKISRVTESADPTNLTVQIELDADALTTVTEYREAADSSDPKATQGRSIGRATRTQYELVATNAQEAAHLQAFSLALRNTIGV